MKKKTASSRIKDLKQEVAFLKEELLKIERQKLKKDIQDWKSHELDRRCFGIHDGKALLEITKNYIDEITEARRKAQINP